MWGRETPVNTFGYAEGAHNTLRPAIYAIKKPRGLEGEYQVAGANRRWCGPFRCRGSRRESAVAQLFSLGIKIGLMVELVGWSGEDLSS